MTSPVALPWNHHGVEYVLYAGERIALQNQVGRYVGSPAAAGKADCPAQQLDAVARPPGQLHILQGQPADPLYGQEGRVHLMPKGQVRQDADLAPGINALDIRRGVRLSIALLLGLPQSVGKGGAGSGPCG